jgi:hypothetical protein
LPVDPATSATIHELAALGVPHLVFINERVALPDGKPWDQASSLPQPREVIHGDALRSREAVRGVKEALWTLVFAALGNIPQGG